MGSFCMFVFLFEYMSVVNVQVLNAHAYTCGCVCPESESLSLISLSAQCVCLHVCARPHARARVCIDMYNEALPQALPHVRVCVCGHAQVKQMKHCHIAT